MLKPISILRLEKLLNTIFNEVPDEKLVLKSRNSYSLDKNGNVISLNATENDLLNLRGFSQFKTLQVLNLRFNHLEDISLLRDFKNLRILDLGGNRINDISPLYLLKLLSSLNLDYNKINDFSPAIAQIAKGSLTNLSIKDNLANLPFFLNADNKHFAIQFLNHQNEFARSLIIENLRTGATSLDLGKTGITNLEFLPELFDCEHLEELILSNEWGEYLGGEWTLSESLNSGPQNNIYFIPKSIKKLKSLTRLISGGDWKPKEIGKYWNQWRIVDFRRFTNLKHLRFVNLSNNKITKVHSVVRLEKLEQLHLNNNRIHTVSVEETLFNLKVLFLSNNQLSNVEFLSGMPNLTTLDLHANRIKDLLPAKHLISKIGVRDSKWEFGTISIRGNQQLMFPSLSVVKRGTTSVMSYFEQLENERAANIKPYKNKDAKLILVGNSNVGKSSLSEYLRTGKYDKKIKSTHWLEIKLWPVKIGTKTVNLRIFDFGGQEYYHDTHHIFFTNRTSYIVLWDRFTNEYSEQVITQCLIDGQEASMPVQGYPVEYWLNSIRYHCEKRTTYEGEKQIKVIQARRIGKSSEFITKEVIKKSVSEGELATQEGKTVRPNILLVQNKVDTQSDVKYLNFDALKESYPEIYGISTISIEELRGLAHFRELLTELLASMDIFEEDILATWGLIKDKLVNDQDQFKNHLTIADFKTFCNNEIRKSLKFKDLPFKTRKTLLFDDFGTKNLAQYLNDIGILLYFSDDKNLSDKVLVNQDQIIKNIYKILFDLNSLNGQFNDSYVITRLGKKKFDDESQTLIDLMVQFKIIFKHPSKDRTYIAPLYLPKKPLKAVQLFLNAFQKPAYRFQFKSYIHKYIILEFFQKYGNKTVSDGTSSGNYYYWRDGLVIKDHSTFEVVLVRFFNGNDEKKECYIDMYRLHDSKDKTFLNTIASDLERIYEDPLVLRAVTLNGKDFVPLKVIEDAEKNNEFVFKHENLYYNLIDFSEYILTAFKMKKIFISYSKVDYAHLQKLENHLSVLKRNGKISTWNCRKLLPGEKWDGKIKKELEEADIILFLVSDDFLATDYIWDIEIKRAIERELAGEATVVPIILRSCLWEDSPLGTYTTAPGKAKVIANAPDIDQAWTETIKQLVKIL